ncbi:MAG: NAD-dependent DNA ligase [bacterium]|nr:NAD-dependent DNA ligase [bacterium]
MHTDHRGYFKFTGRARLDKSINSLLGIIEGISVDSNINKEEIGFLNMWLEEHQELRERHPYSELIPVVENALSDGILAVEEQQDILWLCEKLRSTEFFDKATADIQRLNAVLGGITADGVITEAELYGLSDWLSDHDHLKTCWPYEEIESLITGVLSDKKIDPVEQKLLKEFFLEFTTILDNRTIVNPPMVSDGNVTGLCAVCPEITFSERSFCLTGASSKYSRSEFSEKIQRLGGRVVNSVSAKLHYLIIGADGNPCWAYACYGRKVEKAVELRKNGAHLLLVHENDVHDALADEGV